MKSFKSSTFLFLLFQAIILINHQVRSDDEDNLLQGINKYRASLNLTALTKNDNAACLAEQIADQYPLKKKKIADQYKDQPCTNTTGSNTVPGTENNFASYPEFLSHCHLNITNTRDGQIMPACVPDLDPSLVLMNFTKSQYSGNLNDSTYSGAGIASEGNWIVVVLTTNSSSGSFETYEGSTGFIYSPNKLYHFIMFLLACVFLL